jgi:hypothetical protein
MSLRTPSVDRARYWLGALSGRSQFDSKSRRTVRIPTQPLGIGRSALDVGRFLSLHFRKPFLERTRFRAAPVPGMIRAHY